MTRNRSFKRLALAGCAALAFSAWMEPSVAQPAALRVGITNSLPMGGNPADGYCVDLIDAVATKAGLQVDYFPMPRVDLLPGLISGSIDIACGGTAPTNERRATGIAFTSAILTDAEILVVRATDTTPYTTIDELRGQPVFTAPATPFFDLVQAAGVDLRTYPDNAAGYQAIVAGEIKAVVSGLLGFQYAQQVLGQWPELRRVDTYVSRTMLYNALAVRSADTELLGVLQAALEAFKADGTVATLLDQWAFLHLHIESESDVAAGS